MSSRELSVEEIGILEHLLNSRSSDRNTEMNKLRKAGFDFSQLGNYLKSHKLDVENEKSTPLEFGELVALLNNQKAELLYYHPSCTSYDGDPNYLMCIHLKVDNPIEPLIAVPIPGVGIYSEK